LPFATEAARATGFLTAAFFAPCLPEVVFCAISLSLYPWLHSYNPLCHVACTAESAQPHVAADVVVVPISAITGSVGYLALPTCQALWFGCPKTTPSRSILRHPMRRGRIASLAIYEFQVCSRLHHLAHHNTNFTDFEAGTARFFR